MNITVRQLGYVLTAARLRSISRASSKLGISQSSIAAAIDKMEREFNVTIFVRQQSKGLVITSLGSEVLGHVGRLLSDVENFEQELSGLGHALEGALNVGCFAPVSPHMLPPIINNLTKKHPNIQVHLHEGDLRRVQEFLRDGVVDIALTYNLGLDGNFKCEELNEAPAHVILAESNPLAKQDDVSLTELIDQPMILLDLPESRTYFELLFETVGAHPRIAHRTETYEMVRSLVATGMGFSILNLRPLIDHTYNGQRVICLPIRENVLAPKFILAQRPHDFPTSLMSAFSTACRDYIRSEKAAGCFMRRAPDAA
ncbi:MAG: hypothetical protein COV67_08105 [Nitrospinae bacterium CG11_big_fil_rev_8_21_14_0_20_56_8]|nr:MAG: hypothetical protein COV67_08105 [Nitrospinae bacterium CG11_big_fil_rev_8_21_14_0_20_56_8]